LGKIKFIIRNINWYSHYGKAKVSQKLKIETLHDSANPLLGIQPKKDVKSICTYMFIVTQFMRAQIWK
jgi:hypothetical protein